MESKNKADIKKSAGNKTASKKKHAKKKQSRNHKIGNTILAMLVTIAILMVGLFIYVKVSGEVTLPENALGSLLTPIQDGVTKCTEWVRDTIGGLSDVGKLRSEKEGLEVELMQLEYRISQLQEQEQENERLTSLVSAKSRYTEYPTEHASVVAKDAGRWFDTFTINIGTLKGVEKGMAVITGDGLVGRISEAGLNYSKVISIIDSSGSTACLIQRTRDNGIMKGQLSAASDDDTCRMYYVPSVNDITPGDVVITSGLDQIYPKGLVVGTVVEVSRQTDTSSQYLVIEPAADFEHIEEVLVVMTVVDKAVVVTPLPTATTRAKPTPTPDPYATATPAGAAETQQPNSWAYPTFTPDPNATRAPIQLTDCIEDVWAQL